MAKPVMQEARTLFQPRHNPNEIVIRIINEGGESDTKSKNFGDNERSRIVECVANAVSDNGKR